MERLAWKNGIDPAALIPAGARISLARRSRLRQRPALVQSSRWPPGSKLPTAADKLPDWRWRIETVADGITTFASLPPDLRSEVLAEGVETKPLDEQLVAIAVVHQHRLLNTRPLLRRLVFAPNFGTVHFERQGADSTDVVHRLYTPISAKPFDPHEKEPRAPAARPADPSMAFGPHTVHRAPLKTPLKTPTDKPNKPPEIRT